MSTRIVEMWWLWSFIGPMWLSEVWSRNQSGKGQKMCLICPSACFPEEATDKGLYEESGGETVEKCVSCFRQQEVCLGL